MYDCPARQHQAQFCCKVITVRNAVKQNVAGDHIEVHTGMSPRWIGGVCVCFNMIRDHIKMHISLNVQLS
jgi:hypothetical protein